MLSDATPVSPKRYAWMAAALDDLHAQNCERALASAQPLPGGYVQLAGERLLNLSGNDYLGLASALDLTAAVAAVAGQGAGATASRLLVGNHPGYDELEARLAALHGTEASLVFGSGYLANMGAISALAGRDDAVFSDRANHASIVDGIVLSRAAHYRYRHNDVEHLTHLLRQHSGHRRALIVTESVFSMDGDRAPLVDLVTLKQRHGALLLVDEAHAGGVIGPRGAGLVAELGLAAHVDVVMGTLGKAYGVYGAYLAGPRLVLRYLLNTARSLIFTTGLPPVVVDLALQALERSACDDWRRAQLWRNLDCFTAGLRQAGLAVGAAASPIVPLVVGESGTALALSQALRGAGIAALAIRPPTVPPGTARLRCSVSAAHDPADLAAAAARIGATFRQLGLQQVEAACAANPA